MDLIGGLIVELLKLGGTVAGVIAILFTINKLDRLKLNGLAKNNYKADSFGALSLEVVEKKLGQKIHTEQEAAWDRFAVRRMDEIHKVVGNEVSRYLGAESLYLENQRRMLQGLADLTKEMRKLTEETAKLRLSGRWKGRPDDSP